MRTREDSDVPAPEWADDDDDATTTPADGARPSAPSALTSPLPSPWVPGSRFGSYEIESRLAVGGMAELWRAKFNGLEGFEKRVVIKTMLTQLHDRPDLTAMFVGEASLAARLSHPNIVDVLDFGQLDGRYFIAMEYVPGLTLRVAHRRTIAAGGRLPVVTILHVLADLCEALQHLHDFADAGGPLGLIHRDLSPDNIILSTSGTAKLIDFGAARATARTSPGRLFVGKYRYAAPERIRHEHEDHRSDVYSVGVIFYECLVGHRPFEGSDADVIRAATAAACCDPAERAPGLPPSVVALVRKATAQRPEDRFASARELGSALGACLAELGASSRERDVTAALSALIEPDAAVCLSASVTDARGWTSSSAGPSATPESAHTGWSRQVRNPFDGFGDDSEAVPEPIEPSRASSAELALNEREILEASGPLPREAPPVEDDTRRVSLPPPPEAFAPEARSLEPAVHLFDRGIALRAEGRFGEALEAWEQALALAPENRLYESHVRRLRAQLSDLRRTRETAGPRSA